MLSDSQLLLGESIRKQIIDGEKNKFARFAIVLAAAGALVPLGNNQAVSEIITALAMKATPKDIEVFLSIVFVRYERLVVQVAGNEQKN